MTASAEVTTDTEPVNGHYFGFMIADLWVARVLDIPRDGHWYRVPRPMSWEGPTEDVAPLPTFDDLASTLLGNDDGTCLIERVDDGAMFVTRSPLPWEESA